MKKFKALLLAGVLAVSSVAALASCGPSVPPSGDEPTTAPSVEPTNPSTSNDEKIADRFKTVQLTSALLVGESLDLAEKITVVYKDGSEDHNFTIQENDGYTVDGTVLTFNKAGTYSIVVKAGSNNKDLRYPVKVESQAKRDFSAWFDSIGQNYSVFNVGMDANGNLTPYGFCYHNNNEYIAMYFREDLNVIQAKLNDGNYYTGDIINLVSPVEFEMKFQPGVLNWQNSYGSVALSDGITSDAFSAAYDEEDGYEYFYTDGNMAETFLNYTCMLTYGGAAQELQFLGFVDDENSAGLFAIAVESEGEIAYDLWLITDVDTTAVECIEDYQVNGALPSAVPSHIIKDRFNEVNRAQNYTMLAYSYGLDSRGNEVAPETILEAWGEAQYSYFFAEQVTFVTEESVVVTDGSGNPIFGYADYNNSTYKFGYAEDSTGNLVPAAAPVSGSLFEAASSLCAPVDGIDELNFNSYTEYPGQGHVFGAPAGDATYADNGNTLISKENNLTHHLLSSAIALPSWANITDLGELYCNLPYLTKGGEETYAMSTLIDLQIVVTDEYVTCTVIIDAATLLEYILEIPMAPVSYLCYDFVFTAVGTTTAPDISAFTSLMA